ncbi:MAG: TetR/AcrR family transcriptional regulator [Chitinophagaceae bacterium]|nr:TetR/AcrR family transcriptional regulator [Chitinophagaceae bacterium]
MVISPKHIQILETAEKLFAAKGFECTTVRDIAEEAGVNLAMISYYFGSKAKLMEYLFEHRTGNIGMRVENLLKNDSLAPMEKVELLIDEHIERAVQQQRFHKIMLCEQVINKNPVIIKVLRKIKIRNTQIIETLIKDGQKKGAFKKPVDVVLLLSTMIGTVNQMLINKTYYRDFNKLDDLTDEQLQALIKKRLSNHIKKLFKAILTNEP